VPRKYEGTPSKKVDQRYKDNLKRRYNLEVDEYVQLCVDQGGVCAICRTHTPRLCVDHSHDTGENRGLLCHKCNVGLGHFNDSIQLLADAISYLSKYA
jgi:hypothetical protein